MAPPMTDRVPERSAAAPANRDACSAGTSPKSITAATETPSVKARARPPIPRSSGMATPSDANASSARFATVASNTPAAAPASASIVLSVMRSRTSRPRPAPSARRNAISLRRATARASNRFATFAQMMQSRSPTPIMIVNSGVSNVSRTLENPRRPDSMIGCWFFARNRSRSPGVGAVAVIVRMMNPPRSARTRLSVAPASRRPRPSSHA
jgi:hypothetical protein